MNAPQHAVCRNASTVFLTCGAVALAIAVSGCHRPASRAEATQTARDAATKIKVESVKAGDQLADVWLATKVHSKFVADRDIKATDVSVSAHGGVVSDPS